MKKAVTTRAETKRAEVKLGRSDESSNDDFEEQEMMTVEQAELTEQYVNGDL